VYSKLPVCICARTKKDPIYNPQRDISQEFQSTFCLSELIKFKIIRKLHNIKESAPEDSSSLGFETFFSKRIILDVSNVLCLNA